MPTDGMHYGLGATLLAFFGWAMRKLLRKERESEAKIVGHDGIPADVRTSIEIGITMLRTAVAKIEAAVACIPALEDKLARAEESVAYLGRRVDQADRNLKDLKRDIYGELNDVRREAEQTQDQLTKLAREVREP